MRNLNGLILPFNHGKNLYIVWIQQHWISKNENLHLFFFRFRKILITLHSFFKRVLSQSIVDPNLLLENDKRDRDKEINLNNVIHNVDNFLRLFINKIVESKGVVFLILLFVSDLSLKQLYAKRLSKTKTIILKKVRSICLNEDIHWSFIEYQNYANYLLQQDIF